MSRRSRRELRRVGREPNYLANRRLPRPHEIVPRSVADLEEYSGPLRARLDWPESRPAPGRGERSVRMVRQMPRRSAAYRRGFDVRSLLFGRSFDVFRPPRSLNTVGRAAFCVRRKIRREVMHAFRLAGRRGLGRGGVRRNSQSRYSCR